MGVNCSYSKCICDIPELNHKPDYKVGDYWKLYGGWFGNDIFKIIMVRENQILCEDKEGILKLFNRLSGKYANCGTPELRTKINDQVS